MPSRPEIFILAGPNGAGKTTGAKVVLPEQFQVGIFVNADDFQRQLGSTKSPIAAGRLMLTRMRELRGARDSFAFETTLAARCYFTFLQEAQSIGYLVHLAYIALRTPELARSRVLDRVADGGHDVPFEDIERRFWRGLGNFFDLYQALANTWTLSDNSGETIVVIARSRAGEPPLIYDENYYQELRRAAERAR